MQKNRHVRIITFAWTTRSCTECQQDVADYAATDFIERLYKRRCPTVAWVKGNRLHEVGWIQRTDILDPPLKWLFNYEADWGRCVQEAA